MEVPEATCVLYLLSSLLRDASSIVQALRDGIIVVGGCEGGVKGAFSEWLLSVIPVGIPLGAAVVSIAESWYVW